MQPFILGKWHAWEGVFCILLSDEEAKQLRSFPSIDDCVNWLWLKGEDETARSLNHHAKESAEMSKAIVTKFIGPTSTKGARIKAECAAGSLTIGYPYELSSLDAHAKAAMALVRKLGWTRTGPTGECQNQYCGVWSGGTMEDGRCVFVFSFVSDPKNHSWGLYDEHSFEED